jgi:O-antigen/teichoic acid export membrane protein
VWLTPGTIAYTVSKVLQADLAGRNRQEVTLRAQWIAFVVMVVLDLIFIPANGALGAAAASSAAYITATIYTVLAYSRETLVPVLQCLVPRRSDLMYFREIVSAVLANCAARGPDRQRWLRYRRAEPTSGPRACAHRTPGEPGARRARV